MGLERSSVETRRNCTVMGLSRLRCSSLSLSCTAMLTTGVLMTGRFGTLMKTRVMKIKTYSNPPNSFPVFPSPHRRLLLSES